MHGIRGVPWASFPRGYAETGGASELDDAVAIPLDATTDELQDDRLASNLLQCVFFAINWPEAADSAEQLSTLVANGCEFNCWRRPATS
jgi:hypothetical protein